MEEKKLSGVLIPANNQLHKEYATFYLDELSDIGGGEVNVVTDINSIRKGENIVLENNMMVICKDAEQVNNSDFVIGDGICHIILIIPNLVPKVMFRGVDLWLPQAIELQKHHYYEINILNHVAIWTSCEYNLEELLESGKPKKN